MSVPALCVAVFLLAQSVTVLEGKIIGRVFNADGQPMSGVQMSVLLMVSERAFRDVRATRSDSEGKFVMTAPEGKVMLMAQPHLVHASSETDLRKFANHPPAYFPGVLDRLEAWPIEVKAGEIIELDFHMPPVFIGSIKTVVSGPDGFSLDRVRVLRPEANQIKNVTVSDQGIGYVDSLREGRYAVFARARSRDALLAAHELVQITGGEVTVSLQLEPAAKINGRVIVERGGFPPIDNTRVVAAWTDGGIDLDPLARDEVYVGPDGSFSIDGLFGTRTFRLLGLPADWHVTAIRQGRSDITSSGVDLVPGSATEISIVVAKR